MAKRPLFEFDAKQTARFQRNLKNMQGRTDKDTRALVTQASKAFARRVISATPMAKKKTKWITVTLEWLARAIDIKLPVAWFRSGAPSIATPGRAYGKAGWVRSATRLGIKSGSKFGGSGGDFGAFRDKRKVKLRPSFELINRVPYIVSLDRGGPMPDLPGRPATGQTPAPPQHMLAKGFERAAKTIQRKSAKFGRDMAKAWSK